MPDQEPKKNQHKKGKNDPKEQRKPRQQLNQGAGERKTDKRSDEPKAAASEKPAFEEPGPEFYKSLKRETDEILKITEEANSKYKKKEIQSNWAKYEVPIESYDEVEQQENLGADYEKLIQAPLSLGGHFQFKHEKTWDISTGPSLYDKYFDISINDLATALCTIPFYERNGIDKSIFTESEMQTMDQRTSRYKHKYFKIPTVESEIQDKLTNSLLEDSSKTRIDENTQDERKSESEINQSYDNEISFEESKVTETENSPKEQKLTEAENSPKEQVQVEFVFRPQEEHEIEPKENANRKPRKESEVIDNIDDILAGNENKKPEAPQMYSVSEPNVSKPVPAPTKTKKKPVLESPEDLEKWLDDFLDE